MKKLSILLAALLPVFFMVSCERPGPDDGNDGNGDNLKKRVERVYSQNPGSPLELQSVYHWDKDVLKSVDLYYEDEVYGTAVYSYDGDGKVVKIAYTDVEGLVSDDCILSYEGNKLITDEYYDDVLTFRWVFTYTGDKITQLDMLLIAQDNAKKCADRVARLRQLHPFEQMLPAQAKAAEVDVDYYNTYYYTYEGDNIAKMVLDDNGSATYEYENYFDQGLNPFYNMFDTRGMIDFRACSKNNLIVQEEDGREVESNEYEYDKDNYPVRVENNWGTVTVYEYVK